MATMVSIMNFLDEASLKTWRVLNSSETSFSGDSMLIAMLGHLNFRRTDSFEIHDRRERAQVLENAVAA